MPKVIVLNMGTEHALGAEPGSLHPFGNSVWRHAWFADAGDVIVSPRAIEEPFLEYIGETLGFDPRSVSVITRDELLWDDAIRSPELVGSLRARGVNATAWTIMPCFFTEGIAELAELLGFGDSVGRQFAAQRGHDLFNRKTHFRQLAAGAGLPLAEGAIVRSPRTLARAIEKYIPLTGTVIVKRDEAAGGMGNVTVTRGAVTPLPGSRETRSAGRDINALSTDLWEQLTDRRSQALVVESYHTAAHRFYIEYFIEEDGVPRFLDSGTIRLRPDDDPDAKELVWTGLDIPAELPSSSASLAATLSMQFALQAGRIGYRGHINIDAIVTDERTLIFNEANGRWGGCSVLHALAERLLGERYADDHVLSSVRDLPWTRRAEVLHTLRQTGMHFTPSSNEGVLILACDELATTTMECLVIACSRARVRAIEASLREALGKLH